MPQTLTLLLYDYVPDVVERRAPHRAAHLELISAWKEDGRIVAAGAIGDPPSGALIVLRGGDPEAFMREDPYVEAGLIAGSRIEPWTVVTGEL